MKDCFTIEQVSYIYIYATGSETDQCTASQPMLHSVIVVVTPG